MTTIVQTDSGITEVIVEVSRGLTGATGSIGATGTTGATGAQGDRAGLKYRFSDNNSGGNPAHGKLKFNSATLNSVTRIAVSDIDFDGSDMSGILALIDDSNSVSKARVVIRSNNNADASHFVFLVSGITDEGTHYHINGTYVAGSAFADDEIVTLDFYATGDKGEVGATGPQGATGPTGATGEAGADGDTSVIPIETVSTTTRTVTPSDTGKKLRLTNASGCAITIQLDATAPFTVGHILYFRRVTGSGSPSFVSNGVTINNSKITSIFEGDDFALQNIGANTFEFS